jgi:hypothetical protein
MTPPLLVLLGLVIFVAFVMMLIPDWRGPRGR